MRDIVILSTADWDNPLWTNKQHVAVELTKFGKRVFYIESLGIRPPTLAKSDLGRIWRRLRRGFRGPRQVADGLWVWSPLVIPFQKFALVRAFNKWMVQALLRFWLKSIRFKPDLLWTYSPLTMSLFEVRKYPKVIYHAVDDVSAQPGMPKEIIETAERKLVARADAVFVTSALLFDRHSLVNPRTYYLPNVCDYDHFAKAMDPGTAVPDDISRFPAPRIGFVGAISNYKMDMDLVAEVATAHPDWSFILIGQVGEGEPATKVDRLKHVGNVHFLGTRPYRDLPGYLKGFAVGIIPCALNDYTAAMFPMKFFEYLAAGIPVVSTRLPALKEFDDVAFLRDGAREFALAIEDALDGKAPPLGARLDAARQHTYFARTQRMLQLIDDLDHS